MPSLYSQFPDPDYVLSLDPATLGPILLKMAHDQRNGGSFIPESVTQPDGLEAVNGKMYPYPKSSLIDRHVNSTWNWLAREGFIEPSVGMNGTNGWRDFTAKGSAVAKGQNMQTLTALADFPKILLHPTIRENAWNAIVRRTNATSQDDLANAVRDAFVAVEDAVRTAAKCDPRDYGEPLMKKAFEPDTGLLGERDTTLPNKERVGVRNLFIGAMDAYRNPSAHRRLKLTLDEAKDQLLLASHLLRLVDARKP
jgi:uncharacterized protein (TIGR02391 family)